MYVFIAEKGSRKRKQKYVVVVGFARTGKSSLCRTLGKKCSRKEAIKGSTEYDTNDCFTYYHMEEQGITLIDTPGKKFPDERSFVTPHQSMRNKNFI